MIVSVWVIILVMVVVPVHGNDDANNYGMWGGDFVDGSRLFTIYDETNKEVVKFHLDANGHAITPFGFQREHTELGITFIGNGFTGTIYRDALYSLTDVWPANYNRCACGGNCFRPPGTSAVHVPVLVEQAPTAAVQAPAP